MLLTIITPSILRPSLAETCRSIDEQEFADYEHIVVVDAAPGVEGGQAHNNLAHEKRTWRFCGVRHNNFGNTCRNKAFDLATGDYILNLDDDDRLLPGALQTIADAIDTEPPAWLLFPVRVGGDRWLKVPPGKGSTVSCQFCYRRDLGIRWPDTKEYSADGDLVDALVKVAPPMILDIPDCLAVVEKSRYGAM